MEQSIQTIIDLVADNSNLSAEEKAAISTKLKEADKKITITEFRLDRTEKVKRTTAILLKETIEELEQKRRVVEAQNKELEIEAALEKVRSRSLAVQSGSEFKDVVKVVFEKLNELNFGIDGGAFIITQVENSKDINIWIGDDHAEYPSSFRTPFFETPVIQDIWKAKESGTDFFSNTYPLEVKNSWFEYAFENTDYKTLPDELKKWILEQKFLTQSFAIAKNSAIGIHFYHQKTLSEKEIDILKRFSRVFEQSYIRFLDLQKADAQAREAKIEAALEKVRSRTLTMHKSDELQGVINTIHTGLVELDVKMDSGNFMIFYEGRRDFDVWLAVPEHIYNARMYMPEIDFFPTKEFFDAREKGDDFFTVTCSFEEKNKWFNYAFEHTGLKQSTPERKKLVLGGKCWTTSIAMSRYSGIQLHSYSRESFSDIENHILRRFAKVFEQAYIRFLDLQKAEAQAAEAVKRASVDRVRAEIASMRTTSDLERITPLIWNELTTLGVPFIRCGVFIMDEQKQEVLTMLSTPEGKAIATLHVPFELDLSITTNGLQYWRRKEIYKEYWDGTAFAKAWLKLSSLRGTSMGVSQTEHPPESLYLHLLPFLQGMLYVGSDAQLNEDELKLVQNLADAFSGAYARYEDFNKLETAKKQVDSALDKLQATQKQLIQSEKMASLGELTAGIAHEIQNPLNFVNNFSEVNKELMEELKDEAEKGNIEEVKSIANDVIENSERINHHGKRADAIVKGMLQHSRKSEGVKEPTDINALADEYLRLSYHGMRAKDKEFNADFKTQFDDNIDEINIVPQDIGRVLLNLINNAFYATNEKKKIADENYRPLLSVQTKKINDKVEIKLSDNGNGIPQKIIDKIFQPFFTTKPTGEATGLGLSLSYDIIKAHGGEIKVESKEGEGTIFIIQLRTQ